jgi:hypothetical protein
MFLTAWLTKSSTLSRGSLLNATASAQTRSVVSATFYWASETRLYYRTNLCNFGKARVGIARSFDGLLLAAVDAASPMPQKKASGAWLESTGSARVDRSLSPERIDLPRRPSGHAVRFRAKFPAPLQKAETIPCSRK